MSFMVNDAIRVLVFLGAEGETISRTYSEIAGTETVFTPALTDLGGGQYIAAYTPTVTGQHLWSGESSSGVPVTFEWTVTELPAAVDNDAIAAAVLAAPVGGSTVADQLARISSIGDAEVTVTSPIASTGLVTLTPGDAYLAADGRSLLWSSNGWLGLTGATLVWQVTVNRVEHNYPASLLNSKTVELELTAEQTAAMVWRGVRRYELLAALPSGATVTLASGDLVLRPAG